MRIPPHRRNGFALAIAMVAIVVIGALIAGAFWTSTQEFRSGRNALVQERALAAAEFGQNWILANWSQSWVTSKAPGDTITPPVLTPDANSTARVTLTRLNPYTYWVVSEGASGAGTGGEARRRVNSILRLNVPNVKIVGAVTTAGTTALAGNMAGVGGVNGNDATPATWSGCPPAAPSKPAIANDAAAGSEVTSSGTCGSSVTTTTCLNSTNGKYSQDATAGDASTYNGFGEFTWAQLTALADANHTITATGVSHTAPIPIMDQVSPTAVGGICATSATRVSTVGLVTYGSNWGEPLRTGGSAVPACKDYYPVIWIKGASTAWSRLAGGTTRGQGILLVENNLQIAGSFQFFGLLIVKGTLRVEGTSTGGPKITGAVMTAGSNNLYAGGASVQYSSCAVTAALNAQTPKPEFAPQRGWGNMY